MVPDKAASRSLWLAAGLIGTLFIVPKLFQHATLQTGDLDTGNYSNFAWAIYHGEGFSGSVLGRHHLGEHFSPIMVVVGLVYVVWSNAYVLMLLQGLSVAAAIVLVLGLARHHLSLLAGGKAKERVPLAILLVLFLFYPPLLATWKGQFQPIELGMPLVVLGILLLHARRDSWLALVVLLLLATRESAPLAVLGLAMYAGLALGRWRISLILLLAAAIWATVTLAWLMPHFRGQSPWAHERWFGPGEMWGRKAVYLLTVFLGLGPLPFIGRNARIASLAAVPGVLLNLSVARETQISFAGHYDAQIAPFLMVAAAHGIVSVWAAHARLKFATAIGSLVIGLIVFGRSGTRTPVEAMIRWWPDAKSLAAAREVRLIARQFEKAPAISATSRLGPQVCHRPHYMAMRCGTTHQSWTNWASERLEPGTILLIPTELLADEVAERTLVRKSGRARQVHAGQYVEAWEWPVDAPRPGTPEAVTYVSTAISKKKKASNKRPRPS